MRFLAQALLFRVGAYFLCRTVLLLYKHRWPFCIRRYTLESERQFGYAHLVDFCHKPFFLLEGWASFRFSNDLLFLYAVEALNG